MASPFPSMDPFLEDPTLFPDFHFEMIGAIREQLAAKLEPDFFVHVEQRVYITEPDIERKQIVIADVTIVTPPQPSLRSTMTVPTVTTPTLLEPLYDTEVREHYIEIYDSRNREVVTTIELLSPFDKNPHATGYDVFQRKRNSIMASHVHWVEIDLLREGERQRELTDNDYYALLKRGHRVRPYEVWFFDLRDLMPTIAVPLRPSHPDAALELQKAFESAYARARYQTSVDYESKIAELHLSPADARWAQERVLEWLGARHKRSKN